MYFIKICMYIQFGCSNEIKKLNVQYVNRALIQKIIVRVSKLVYAYLIKSSTTGQVMRSKSTEYTDHCKNLWLLSYSVVYTIYTYLLVAGMVMSKVLSSPGSMLAGLYSARRFTVHLEFSRMRSKAAFTVVDVRL